MTENQLKKLGKKVTGLRKVLRESALGANQNFQVNPDEYLATTEKLARKMHKGYFVQAAKENIWKERNQTK